MISLHKHKSNQNKAENLKIEQKQYDINNEYIQLLEYYDYVYIDILLNYY